MDRRRMSTRKKWRPEHSHALRAILRQEPDLYLDEIQDRLLMRSNQLFSTTTIWKEMQAMNYSLKVAYERACQRDEIERAEWVNFLDFLNAEPACFVFLDETHKGAKESRRRRHWMMKGRVQPFYDSAFYGDVHDNRCVC